MEGYFVEQAAPSQAHQDSFNPLVENVTHAEFRATHQVLSQVLMNQENRKVVALMNPMLIWTLQD